MTWEFQVTLDHLIISILYLIINKLVSTVVTHACLEVAGLVVLVKTPIEAVIKNYICSPGILVASPESGSMKSKCIRPTLCRSHM